MRRRGYSIAANASFSFFFNALYAVALTWCAFELLHGTMSYGTLMAVLQLVARIQAPVSSLSGMLPQLYQTLASAERLMEVAALPRSEGCLPVTAEEFYQRFSGVRMRDLAFSYDDDETEGAAVSAGGMEASPEEELVSLTCADVFVPKGSFVVVEGPSGSGKSTLFKLLLGAYNADGFAYELAEGAVTSAPAASDAPAAALSAGATTAVSAYAASRVPPGVFAYVPQDNFLFAGSIRENVAFAALDATDDQVKRACEVACAWGFVEELPLGLDTTIGEHGQGLSQGQLQRLAIARAVCSGAPIMVLDEVTSALDDATEAAVLANIASLPGKTVFVAAHRAKAREFATMRLHVEDGVLTEAR